jgi:hypothetical protein
MRSLRWVAAASVTALAFAAGPTMAADASSQATRLTHVTAAAAPSTVYLGSRTVVSGVATPKVAGSVVALQRLESGHWRTVSHERTGKGGKYAFSVVAAKRAASWPLRVSGTGATSKTVHVHITKLAFHVHSTTAATVTVGSPVVVSGSVSPRAPGKVQLQVLTGGAWHAVATAVLTKTSTFTLRITEPLGSHRLRVARPFTTTIAGGVGHTTTVTVIAKSSGNPTPPPVNPAAPTVAITLGGATTSPGSYAGTVTATITAAATAGVRSVSYALDGGAATAYSAPVVVTSLGSHTLVATVTDDNGLVATATATWVQHAPASSGTDDFTAGGTVSASCLVTGFDGVLPNTAGTQCDAGQIAFVPAGLSLTSTPGQLADNDQQNALYKAFDASSGDFTVTARVVGGTNKLADNYQQIGAFFGPDQGHFVKVEAEHNTDAAPHLTMYYRDDGTNGTVQTVVLPALATASTVDLIIRASAGQLTVYYSINGATAVQVGTSKTPATPSAWFSTSAKAGIEVSNSGTTTPVTAIYSRFAITTP